MQNNRSAIAAARPAFCAESLEPRTLLSGPEMVRDLNTGPAGQDVYILGTIGDWAIFAQEDGTHGVELWRSNATRGGTVLLKDINPGDASSIPMFVARVGKTIFFNADDGNGRSLWRTDGNPGGTFKVAHFQALEAAVVGGALYAAGDIDNGAAVWKSDGTPGGTRRITPVFSNSGIDDLIAFRDRIYFSADDGKHGQELWRTDATGNSAAMFADFEPGSASSSPGAFVATPKALYFIDHQYDNRPHQQHLWRTDGGTPTIVTNTDGLSRYSIAAIGNTVYFTQYKTAELWRTDGTPAGTKRLKSDFSGGFIGLSAGTANRLFLNGGHTVRGDRVTRGDFYAGTQIGNYLYYTKSSSQGEQLWRTDGSPQGTEKLAQLPAERNRFPGFSSFTKIGTSVYFVTSEETSSFTGDYESTYRDVVLWKTDGTPPGTMPVKPLPRASFISLSTHGVAGINLFLVVEEPGFGRELWKSNGTNSGTRIIRDIFHGTAGADPILLGDGVGGFYYFATDRTGRTGLWLQPPDRAPAKLLSPDTLPQYARDVYFGRLGDQQLIVTDKAVWRSNGTKSGTRAIFRAPADTESKTYQITDAFVVNDSVFVEIYHADFDLAEYSHSFWRVDGVTGKATKLRDGNPYDAGTTLGDRHITTHWEYGDEVAQLVSIDPTGRERVLRTHLNPYSRFIQFRDQLYFIGLDSSGSYLWRTDGTAGGTKRVKQLPGLAELAVAGDTLFLIVGESDLWTSDGTSAGTKRVKTVFNPPADSWPAAPMMISAGDRLFFSGNDPKHGQELWVSDGTAAGTHLVKDIAPGASSSLVILDFPPGEGDPLAYIPPPAVFNDTIYFIADDGVHGYELWMSDGTGKGTRIVKDISRPSYYVEFAGLIDSAPQSLRVSGKTLYFTATDLLHGRELWAFPLT